MLFSIDGDTDLTMRVKVKVAKLDLCPLEKVPASSFGLGVKLCDNVDVDTPNFQIGFVSRWQFGSKIYLTTTLSCRASAPLTTMMAARERLVSRSNRRRRRGGEELGGEGGGGVEVEEVGGEGHEVCSVITLSSSPYSCLLPIL